MLTTYDRFQNVQSRKQRLYSLFILIEGKYVRCWWWETGEPFPAFTLNKARLAYQNQLLAPYTQGWDSLFELHPVKAEG